MSLSTLDSLVSYDCLKSYLRKGSLSDKTRTEIWPILTSLPIPSDKVKKDISVKDLYEDISASAASIFKFICAKNVTIVGSHAHINSDENDEKSYIMDTSSLLIQLLKTENESPEFFNSLFLMIIKLTRRADISYVVSSHLLADNTKKYVIASNNGMATTCLVFKSLLEEHMPKTYIHLKNLDALKDQHLEMMFGDFFVELLPEPTVLRIIDTYLLEGIKVLYRYALALIQGYKRMIKNGSYHSGDDFWLAVKTDSTNCGGVLPWKLLYISEKLPPVGTRASNSGALSSNAAFHNNAELIHKYAFQSGFESILVLKQRWIGQQATSQKIRQYSLLATQAVSAKPDPT